MKCFRDLICDLLIDSIRICLEHAIIIHYLINFLERGYKGKGKIFHSLGNDKTSNEDVAAKIFNSLNSNAQFK